MKTVQQCLQECNIDNLVEQYLFKHPMQINPSSESSDRFSLHEFFELYKSNIYKLIHNVINTEIDEDDETWIFFVHHSAVLDEFDIDISLVRKSELLDPECITMSYAYEFSKISESAGFFIADTYLTQFYLQDVLIDYLYESSFFGFDQEYLDEHLDRLCERSEYVNSHIDELLTQDTSVDYTFELEKRDKLEEEAWNSYLKAQIKYTNLAFQIEERKVIQLLEAE